MRWGEQTSLSWRAPASLWRAVSAGGVPAALHLLLLVRCSHHQACWVLSGLFCILGDDPVGLVLCSSNMSLLVGFRVSAQPCVPGRRPAQVLSSWGFLRALSGSESLEGLNSVKAAWPQLRFIVVEGCRVTSAPGGGTEGRIGRVLSASFLVSSPTAAVRAAAGGARSVVAVEEAPRPGVQGFLGPRHLDGAWPCSPAPLWVEPNHTVQDPQVNRTLRQDALRASRSPTRNPGQRQDSLWTTQSRSV